MIMFFRRAVPLLSEGARRRFWLACVVLMALATIEALALALIAPLMAILLAPGFRSNSRFVKDLTKFLGNPAPGHLAFELGVTVMLLYLVKSVAAVFVLRWEIGFLLAEEASLVRRIMDSYLRAPYREFLEINSSQRIRTLTYGVRTTFSGGFVGGIGAVGDSFSVVLVTVILLIVNPLIAVAAGVYFGAVSVTYQRITNHHIVKRTTALHRLQAIDFQNIHQALTGVKEIKIRGVEDSFVDEVYNLRAGLIPSYRTMALVSLTPRYILELAMVGAAATIAAVAYSTESVTVATGALALFLVGGFRIVAPLNKIIFGNSQCRASMPSLEQVEHDLRKAEQPAAMAAISSAPAVSEPVSAVGSAPGNGAVPKPVSAVGSAPGNGAVPKPTDGETRIASRIVADNVGFSYVAGRPVLTEVSFEVEPGESVGLVGSSGAGKSTLVDILLGLLEPDNGAVYIDGHPLSSVGRQWRGSIGYVPQSIALFDDTVRANVALRAPGGDDDIWRALTMSQLEETVRALPDGLDTIIGEHGTRLSGGQRQRLGVARALFCQPRVMMFDEATSALDNDTESKVTEVLESLRGTITTITIAHRLSTVRRCDRLFYLEGGRLVARGTFAELVHEMPDFARLVELSTLEV